MKTNRYKIIFLFVFVVACAYFVRNFVYQREVARIAGEYKRVFGKDIDFIPFLVESSMMYSYAEDVGCGEGIPEFDKSLVGMEDLSVHKQFTTGLEYFLGYGYRLKNSIWPSSESARSPSDYEDNPDFTKWIRIQLRLWISLISGLIFLWLVILRIPLRTALLGGLLHAVSSAAIARYTAQDIVRGNFTLPLIIGTFVAAAWFLRSPSKKKLLLSGFVSFLALSTWDLTQLCFSLWCVAEIARVLSGGRVNAKRRHLWYAIAVSAVFASVLIPYHREHRLILSPFVMILLPLVVISHCFAVGKSVRERLASFAVSILVFSGVWFAIMRIGSFSGNYSHFIALMEAKIRFLNVKPSNPNLLDFDARSVWVPEMQSANRFITKAMFPMMLHVAAIALLLSISIKTVRRALVRNMGMVNIPLFMGIFYSISFFFIVRYHVFAAVFLSVLLPILLHIWMKTAKDLTLGAVVKSIAFIVFYFTVYIVYFIGVRMNELLLIALSALFVYFCIGMVCVLIAAGIYKLIKKRRPSLIFYVKGLIFVSVVYLFIFEVDGLQKTRRYEKYFFPETAALVKWLRTERIKAPIMADFELSPLLKAYCGSKIILQPKFELRKTRENYKKFINIMFHGDEEDLARFCKANKAKFFVFNKGYANSQGPFSPRYMAAAVELEANSPVCMMNSPQNRKKLKRFHEIKPPRDLRVLSDRYIMFKVY